MVIATTSLLSAVEVIEKAFANAGRQPLSPQEEQLLKRVKRVKLEDGEIKYKSEYKTLEEQTQFWQDSLVTLPRELISQKSE